MAKNTKKNRRSVEKVDKKTVEWGLVKFKPAIEKTETTYKNPFNQPQRFNRFTQNERSDKYHQKRSNERVRFNPISRDARPENPTPWSTFKDEITHKQREEEQTALQANMDTEEGKKFLKQREINYRKMLMEQKQQEPTKWEDFGNDDDNGNNDSEKGKKGKNKEPRMVAEEHKESEPSYNKSEREKYTNNNKNHEQIVKPFISKELLKDFDATKLTYSQKDCMRKLLTKASTFGVKLELAVKNRKRQLQKNKLKKELHANE